MDISPKISGYIKEMYVKDNQNVKAGDLILQIDPKDYELQAQAARAILIADKAALAVAQNDASATMITQPAGLDTANRQVQAAQAKWEKDLADRKRMEMLIKTGACAEQEYDQAVAIEKSARANLAQMKDNVRSASAAPEVINSAKNKVEQLKAQVEKAQADLSQAEENLRNTKIVAPMDGRITKKSVNKGAYLESGTKICSLVSFDLWITANFKENQLNGMHPGNKVIISVDAFPNIKFTGKIDSFQAGTGAYFSLFPMENATGNFVKTVQRVPVKIIFDKTSSEYFRLLGPGMSVVPTVYKKIR